MDIYLDEIVNCPLSIVNSLNGRLRDALGGLILSTWVTVGATSVAFTSR